MAIEQLQMAVGICDTCGTRRHGGPDGEPPKGVAGTVVTVYDETGPLVHADWFSCRSASGHVGKAINAAIARDAQDHRTGGAS